MKFFTTNLTIFVLGILTLGFISCSSDDDKDNGLRTSDIVGTWKFSEVSTDGGLTFSTWTLEKTSATFNSDGTYYGSGYFGNGNGTWKQNGNNIITYVEGQEYLRYEIKDHTSVTCTLVVSKEGSSSTIWVRCIKTNVQGTDENTISKSELESITSFVYTNNGDNLHIKFREGHVYTKEIDSDGMAFNEDDIIYTLSGNKITMEMGWQKTSGTIYKISYNNGQIGIVMDFDGTYGIATWLSKTFRQSDYQF